MTVRRDEPETVTTAVNTGAPEKAKKAATPPPAADNKTKKPGTTGATAQTNSATTPAVVPPKVATAPVVEPVKPVTPPVVTPPVVATTETATKTAEAQPVKPAVTEKTEEKIALNSATATPGQIPATTETKPAGTNLLEGGENLGRDAQRELARLGCYGGNVNDRWGKGSRAAIKLFNQSARYAWPDWPNPDLIASLRRYPDGFCKKCRGGSGDCEIAAVEPGKVGKPADAGETPANAVKQSPVTAVDPAVLPQQTPPAKVEATPPTTPPTSTQTQTQTPPPAQVATKEEGVTAPTSTASTSPATNTYLPPSARTKAQDNEPADEDPAEQPAKKRKQSVVRADPDEEPEVAPKRSRRENYSRPRRQVSRDDEEEPRPRTRHYYSREYSSGGGGSSWGVGGWPGAGPRSVGR